MKKIDYSLIWLWISGLFFGMAVGGYITKEYILSNTNENLKSNIKFEWEGLDKDIPADGIRKLQLTTNGDTVYLNSVDE